MTDSVTVSLAKPVSQAEFAAIIGVSQATVSNLRHAEILPTGGNLQQWIHAYCHRLREQAAGRMGEGKLNPMDENAALAKAKREAIELKNAIARGESAPVSLLTEVLANASKTIADGLDALPITLGRRFPDFTPDQRDALATALAEVRNQWAKATVTLDVQVPTDDTPDTTDAIADA